MAAWRPRTRRSSSWRSLADVRGTDLIGLGYHHYIRLDRRVTVIRYSDDREEIIVRPEPTFENPTMQRCKIALRLCGGVTPTGER